MKNFIITMLIMPSMAVAQIATPDSITTHELDEVTITATNQYASASKTVYIPKSNQRNSASDGIQLLSRMNIPQLDVNPIAESVKTIDNQGVSLFINSHPATVEDVRGLNPTDVKRVEYMDSPTDPRFMRAEHVINFVTVHYTYGGYTKLSDKERFGIKSGDASVYSKFTYHKMEYDIIANGTHDFNSHIGSQSTELYKFDGGTITRRSATMSGRHGETGLYAGFRATWNRSNQFTLRNTLTMRHNKASRNSLTGIVSIENIVTDAEFHSSAPFSNSALGWECEVFSNLGRGWSINGIVKAEHRDNSRDNNYESDHSTINNSASEDAWSLRENMQLNKTLSDKVGLFANITSGNDNAKIDYSGTSNATNRFRQTFIGTYIGASLNLNKISGSVDGGYALESNRINRNRTDDRYPFTHVSLQYAPNMSHSLSVWLQYATFSPDASMKNPNIIRESEMMCVGGNLNLKCSRHISSSISYTILHDNRWQLTAYATLFRIINRQIAVYTPDGPDGMMLKKYHNDGDYNHGQIGARITGNIGRLSASIAPRILLYKTTGSNRSVYNPLCCSINVNYYVGKIYLNGYWGSGLGYVDGDNSYQRRLPSEYSAGAGWSDNKWNIQLSLANVFRSSWKTSDDTLRTRWYDVRMTQFGSDFHRRISLSITYTLNYGRNVSKTNELTGDSNISTSILK